MPRRPREVLGVDDAAGRDDIIAAYRKLAMKWHPDRNTEPQAKERFQEIQNAYQTLQSRLVPKNTRALWEDMVNQSGEQFSQELYDESVLAQFPFLAVFFLAAGAAVLVIVASPGDIVLFSLAVAAAHNAYKIGTSRRALQVESAFRLAVRLYFIGLLAWGVLALGRRIIGI